MISSWGIAFTEFLLNTETETISLKMYMEFKQVCCSIFLITTTMPPLSVNIVESSERISYLSVVTQLERGALELPSQVFDSPESVFLTTTHSEFPLWRKQRVAVLEEEAGDSITIPLGNSPS